MYGQVTKPSYLIRISPIVVRRQRNNVVRNASAIAASMRRASLHLHDKGPPVSQYERTRHWINYAKEYLAASEHLRSREIPLFQPWIQVSGHSVECSIKSFLCAMGQVVHQSHDLVNLLDSAQSAGLVIDERDIAMLVHLNHQYFCDIKTQSRYKARYPTDRWEMIGGTIPDQKFLERIVQDFCRQAASINEGKNRTPNGPSAPKCSP